jgi:hypothetical protein
MFNLFKKGGSTKRGKTNQYNNGKTNRKSKKNRRSRRRQVRGGGPTGGDPSNLLTNMQVNSRR